MPVSPRRLAPDPWRAPVDGLLGRGGFEYIARIRGDRITTLTDQSHEWTDQTVEDSGQDPESRDHQGVGESHVDVAPRALERLDDRRRHLLGAGYRRRWVTRV